MKSALAAPESFRSFAGLVSRPDSSERPSGRPGRMPRTRLCCRDLGSAFVEAGIPPCWPRRDLTVEHHVVIGEIRLPANAIGGIPWLRRGRCATVAAPRRAGLRPAAGTVPLALEGPRPPSGPSPNRAWRAWVMISPKSKSVLVVHACAPATGPVGLNQRVAPGDPAAVQVHDHLPLLRLSHELLSLVGARIPDDHLAARRTRPWGCRPRMSPYSSG